MKFINIRVEKKRFFIIFKRANFHIVEFKDYAYFKTKCIKLSTTSVLSY